MSTSPLEITPLEAQRLINQKMTGEPATKSSSPTLIDVREPEEEQICRIEGALLIPMGTVPARVAELKAIGGELVIFCHHGVRSLHVVEWLRRQGINNARSLAGGIDRWSSEVDPTVPRY